MRKHRRIFLELVCSGCMCVTGVSSALAPVMAIENSAVSPADTGEADVEAPAVRLVPTNKITLTITDSSNPWNNGSDVAANTIDGNLDTFFDGVQNGYIIYQLGEEPTDITGIGFAPRVNNSFRIKDGIIAGSNDGESWTVLYTIPAETPDNVITKVPVSEFNEGVSTTWKYIKYYKEGSEQKDCANIAEFEVYDSYDESTAQLPGVYPVNSTQSTLPQNVTINGTVRSVSWNTEAVTDAADFAVVSISGIAELKNYAQCTVTTSVQKLPDALEYMIDLNSTESGVWQNAKRLYPNLINNSASDQGDGDTNAWGMIGLKGTSSEGRSEDYGPHSAGSTTDYNPYDNGYWAGSMTDDSRLLRLALTLPKGRHTLMLGSDGSWWNGDAARTQDAYWKSADGQEYKLGTCDATNPGSSVSFTIDLPAEEKGTLVIKKTGTKDPILSWVTVSNAGEALDRSELEALVNSLKDNQEADFSAASWEGFPDALASAQAQLVSPLATADSITSAKEALEQEADELRHLYTLTFKNGDETFATVVNAIEGELLSTYIPTNTPSSDGNVFLGWGISDDETVSGDRLEFAAQYKGDVAPLQALIVQHKDKLTDDGSIPDTYTNESYAKFADAMTAAQTLVEKENPTVEEIDSAITELLQAAEGLKEAVILTFKDSEDDDAPTTVKVELNSAKSTWNIPEPSKAGYTFVGWSPELPATATEAATFTAVFELNIEGLVSYYPFNGNPSDHIGTIDGTSIEEDGISYDDEGKNGQSIHIEPGKGLKFEGDREITDDSDWTISFWAKSDLTYSNDASDQSIFSIMSNQDEKTKLALRLGLGSTAFGIRVNSTSGGILTVERTQFLHANEWNHFTYVHDDASGKVHVYVDGVKKGGSVNDAYGSAWKIYFPGYYMGKSDFQGSVDELRIYNTALNADQVSAVYASDANQRTKKYTITFKQGDSILTWDEFDKDTPAADIEAAAKKALSDAGINTPEGCKLVWDAEFTQVNANAVYTASFKVDKTALQEKFDELSKLSNEEQTYTEASFEALQNALSAADTVLKDENATVESVSEALSNLNTAKDGLVENVTVSFVTGTEGTINPITTGKGSTISAPQAPVKGLFTFDGWFKDGEDTAFDFSTPITEDMTLTAKWSLTKLAAPTDLKVEYKRHSSGALFPTFSWTAGDANANGHFFHIMKPDGTEINEGTEIREGTSFECGLSVSGVWTWKVRTLGNKEEGTADSDYTEGSVTVAGVSFDTQIDDSQAQTVYYIAGMNIEKPADPTRENYVFGGWYKEADCANAFDFESEKINSDLTLYAKWTPVAPATHTVTFNTNGGSVIESATVENNATVAKPTDPTKEHFVFDGWYSDAELKNVYNFSAPVTGNITLYAKWTPVTYTVTFNTDGGSAVASATVNSNAAVAKPTDPTKENFVFDGWYSDAELKNEYVFTTPVTGNITLYAKWSPVPVTTYTVTFETNGGSTIDAVEVNANQTLTKPADPTLSGARFDGWYTDTAFEHAFDFSTPVTSDMTLYAKWRHTYAVMLKGGSDGGTDRVIPVLEGSKITRPSDPVWEGYRFTGWYADEDLTTEFNFDQPITQANTIIYAGWIETSVTPSLDYTLLDQARTKAASISTNLASFKDTGKAAFERAKAAADAIRTSDSATQDDLDDAAMALNDALLALRKAPSASALETLPDLRS